ncbi:MAG TPA: DUF5668 domain-containing protein [Bacteroidota bacterium]|nr:DUF5668 domain-containing protein [Bacteroidota bacterium]
MNTYPIRISGLGVVLIAVGLTMLLHRLNVVWIPWRTTIFFLVAAVGAVKLYNGIALKSKGKVFWGMIWFTVGLGLLLDTTYAINLTPGLAVSGLMIAVGLGFMLMFGVRRSQWFHIVPGLIFLAAGSLFLAGELGYLSSWDVAGFCETYWPVGLILFGAALLANYKG